MQNEHARAELAQLLAEYAEQFCVQLTLAGKDIEKIKEISIRPEAVTEFAEELFNRLNPAMAL